MNPDPNPKTDLETDPEAIEVELLLEALHRAYGHDFRDYGRAHLTSRIRHRMALSGAETISALQGRLLREPVLLSDFLMDLSVNVTEFFRDPDFFRAVRTELVPRLKTYPSVRVWHAGCATGEEVYSMAILLAEEGLLDRCRIYATDFNPSALERGKRGIFAIDRMREYTQNYQKSGGRASFADYFAARYGSVIFDPALRRRISFFEHNLVTDGPPGEMHLAVCRNVLIYFNRKLQTRVVRLFRDSLIPGGFLCLGTKESLEFTGVARAFQNAVPGQRIYRLRPEGGKA
ncbi:MAG: CheR family methyltransferase [Desulfococcaceae bacterium]